MGTLISVARFCLKKGFSDYVESIVLDIGGQDLRPVRYLKWNQTSPGTRTVADEERLDLSS